MTVSANVAAAVASIPLKKFELSAVAKDRKLPNVASADLQKKLLRQADYDKWSKDFLNSK